MRNIILSAVLATAILGTSAFGFEQQGVKEGNSAVTLGLRHSTIAPDEGHNLYLTTIDASYSYFVTDGFEVGLGFGLTRTDGGDYENTLFTYTPYIAYNFVNTSETLVPYISIGATFLSYEYSENNTAAGSSSGDNGDYSGSALNAELGLKVFATEDVAIVPALYTIRYSDVENHGLKVGVQFFF